LLVSLVVYVMASASQAMQVSSVQSISKNECLTFPQYFMYGCFQSGLRKSLIYHHEVNILTCLAYLALTNSWYVWALSKSWPSVSDQFSFSFTSDSGESSEIPGLRTNNTSGDSLLTSTPPSTLITTTPVSSLLLNATHSTDNKTTDIPTILNTLVAPTINTRTTVKRLLYKPEYESRNDDETEKVGSTNNNDLLSQAAREFYTLWSPGFVALYVIHRTG